MKPIINPNLFLHDRTSSGGFNNLCTIIHHLENEGDFFGQVFQGKRGIASFTLTYRRALPGNQVNIDLSSFDTISFVKKDACNQGEDHFEVGQEGYVVFYASGHHTDLYVQLLRPGKSKAEVVFDSRTLQKGDMISFRVWRPGGYSITNTLGKEKCRLRVKESASGKYVHPSKYMPLRILLTAKGFEPATIEQEPVQALVIEPSIPCRLDLIPEKSAIRGSTKDRSQKKK